MYSFLGLKNGIGSKGGMNRSYFPMNRHFRKSIFSRNLRLCSDKDIISRYWIIQEIIFFGELTFMITTTRKCDSQKLSIQGKNEFREIVFFRKIRFFGKSIIQIYFSHSLNNFVFANVEIFLKLACYTVI